MPEQNRLSLAPGGHNSPEDYIQSLLSCAPVRAVMEYLKEKDAETLAVQKELCSIPSPLKQKAFHPLHNSPTPSATVLTPFANWQQRR